MQDKKIFISHSSKDKGFTSWLSNLLICLGTNSDTIFYSSDFRQGVCKRISDEVRQALKKTVLDIIVLSNEYRKSEYCLNEAGIIWFKSEESEKSVIVLSLSSELIQAGFIDNDYIQLRLMDPNFLGKLSDRLKEMLSKHGLRQSQADFTCFNKLVIELEDYKKGLPFIENLIIPYTSEGSKDIELSKISDAWNRVQQFSYRNPNELKVYPYIFYKEYIRQIRLSASDIPGKIRVKTITKSVIVNLSSKDYADEYSSLFLKKL